MFVMLDGVYGVASKLEIVPSLLAKKVCTSKGCSSETESMEPGHWEGTPACVDVCGWEEEVPGGHTSGGSAIV